MSSRENIFKTKDLVDRSSWKECTPTARALHCLFTNRVSLRSVNLDSSLPWNIVHLLQSSQRCIIAHYGTFRKCWDSVILTAILYVATIVPYNAAFFKSENIKTHTYNDCFYFNVQRFRWKLSSAESGSLACIWWPDWGNFYSWYNILIKILESWVKRFLICRYIFQLPYHLRQW